MRFDTTAVIDCRLSDFADCVGRCVDQCGYRCLARCGLTCARACVFVLRICLCVLVESVVVPETPSHDHFLLICLFIGICVHVYDTARGVACRFGRFMLVFRNA